jgi:catechol 2,3-dioxygenase-like lactoylglutathione lyase family enzyme
MPLGDPHGGKFEYTTEGLPHGLAAVAIPSRDVARSVRFYNGLLKMEIMSQNEDEAILKNGDSYVMIKKSQKVGVDTGVFLRTDSPYDLHRRLVDEGVIFVIDPKKCPLGLMTSFRDDDGNVIYALELQI